MRNAVHSALALTIALTTAGNALAKNPSPLPQRLVITAKDACTEKETWSPESGYTKYIQGKLAESMKDNDSAAMSMLEANRLGKNAKTAGQRYTLDYWQARILYDLKLFHFARERFRALVVGSNALETLGIRIASMECLNRIRRAYPTLTPEADLLANAQILLNDPNMPSDKREVPYETVMWSARAKLSKQGPDADINIELGALSGSGAFEAYVRTLLAAKNGSEAEILAQKKLLANSETLPDALKPSADQIQLIFGDAYYGMRRYTTAAEHLRTVGNKSNYFSQAMTHLAWAHLLDRKQSEAMGAAANLIVGGLRQTFAPEAQEVAAIALNEACYYSEAIQMVRAFKKGHVKTWQWLNAWKANPSSYKLYPLVGSYLKGNPQKIPNKVGTEWIRSPIFLANQDEINLVYDEKLGLGWLSKTMREKGGKKYGLKAPKQIAQVLIKSYPKFVARQAGLIKEINLDLIARNQTMLRTLNATAENLQLVEAEAFSSLGDQMIAANLENQAKLPLKPKQLEDKKSKSVPVWEWGRFPAQTDESEQTEVWEDELGWLKTDLKNKCKIKL